MIVGCFVGVFAIVGCNDVPQSADQKMQENQEQMQAEANKQAGLPRIVNFQELKNLNWTYELRDTANLATYTYTQNLNGQLLHVCDSIGFPFPYGTQRSNPQKVERLEFAGAYGTYTLPQAEPNGIFPPSTAEASWVICINPLNPKQIAPIYVEPRVVTSLWKLNSVGDWGETK